MDFEEYEFYKRELFDQIDRPYIMHDPDLASAFFEQLKIEIPEAEIFTKNGSQYITASTGARSALLGILTGRREALEKELQELDQLIGRISGEGAAA